MSLNNKPDRPIKDEFYVMIVSEDELSKDMLSKFYKAVESYSPKNVLTTHQIRDDNNIVREVALVHRINDNKEHEYSIPLVRNLTPNEITVIAENLNAVMPEGDFLFESSTFDEECCPYEDHSDLYIEEDIHYQIAEKLSERVHNQWMNERMKKGWTFGPTKSHKNRTHPLLKPWSQLPEEQQTIDYDLPQIVLDLLEEYGYTVISVNELNELIHKSTKK